MFKMPLLKSVVAIALLSVCGLASAVTANLSVTASVSATCSVTTTALTFGTYDPIVTNATTPLNATGGTIVVTCTKATTGATVTMGQGGNYGDGTAGENAMKGGTTGTYLSYIIYQPPNNTPGTACSYGSPTAWTTSGGGVFTLPTSTGTAQTFNVCGQMPAGQTGAEADSYSDTVVVTVTP